LVWLHLMDTGLAAEMEPCDRGWLGRSNQHTPFMGSN
jgi:hypothetical protein